MKNESLNPATMGVDLSSFLLADKFMCECQKPVVRDYWSEYADLVKDLEYSLAKIPSLYAQEKLGRRAIVYAHYFVASTDIFITECDGDVAFGYAILNGDYDNSEMGYFSIGELTAVPLLNLDFHWEPQPLDEVLHEVCASYFG